MAGKPGTKWGSTPERDAWRAARALRKVAYTRWEHMMGRCYNPEHHKFYLYGGRGIAVAQPWHDFETYYRDIGDCPAAGMTLDRTDNNGNYGPGNWRWATMLEQIHNRRPYKRRTRAEILESKNNKS